MSMKITLIHNPGRGEGQDARRARAAHHRGRPRGAPPLDKKDWKQLLQEPADLVVAAGGDGTVRQVALEPRPSAGCRSR